MISKPTETAPMIMNIQSSVIADDVLHHCTLPNGEKDEVWGLQGIEGLLTKYLDGDEGERVMANPDIALHFFRKMHEIMEGEYTLNVDVTADADIVNIRIARPGQQELRYPNRFILFESTGWWLQ